MFSPSQSHGRETVSVYCLWTSLRSEVQREEAHADPQGTGTVSGQMLNSIYQQQVTVLLILCSQVWPMSVASTVSRLPTSVKVVPASTREEKQAEEQQKRAERDEDGSQRHCSQQTQAEQESAQTGKENLSDRTEIF